MRLNGWLDELIQVGGDVASNIFRPTQGSTYPVYTPPTFPTSTQQYPYTTRPTSGAADYTPLILGAGALVALYLFTRRR